MASNAVVPATPKPDSSAQKRLDDLKYMSAVIASGAVTLHGGGGSVERVAKQSVEVAREILRLVDPDELPEVAAS